MRITRYAITIFCISLFFTIAAGAVTEEEYQEEIRLLQQRNAQLENSLEEVTAELQQSDVTITMLKKQIMEMTSEAEEHAREVAETRSAMKQVKDQLTALLAQQTDVDVKNLELQLTTAVQRAQQVEAELQRAKLEIEEQDKVLARLQRQQAEGDSQNLQQQLTTLQAELQQQREQFKATVNMLQDREVELKASQAAIQQLQAQVRTVSTDQRVEELEATLAEVNAKLIALAQENTTLEKQLHGTQQNEQQLATKDAEIARLENELRKAANYINTRATDISALEQDKTTLQTRQLGLEKTIIELEMNVREMESANNELETRLTAVTAQNTDLESRLESIQAAKTELETQLMDIAESKSGVESRLTKALEERSSRIRQLELDLQEAQSRIDSAQAKQREADQMNLEQNATIQKLQADLQYQSSVPGAAKERIKELTQELQDVKAQFDTQETMKREYPQLQQDVSAYKAQLQELVEEQDRCQASQSQLREQVFGLEQARERLELTLQEKLAELDAVSIRNVELQQDVVDEADLRKADTQTYRDTLVKNRELEQQYAESMRQLKLKEQVLQQALTDKALLERQLEDSGGSISSLRAQLDQAQRQYAEIQQEVMTLRQIQAEKVEAQHDTTSAQALLQQQVQQEKTLRRQLEAELLEAQKTVQALQQQTQTATSASTAAQSPVSIYSGITQGSPLQMLFPQEIIQSLPGSTVTILSVSPHKTRIAYQESAGQTERLWMLHTGTRQVTRLLEWQRAASVTTLSSRFAWAYDDDHFLFSTGNPGGYGLYLGNSNGIVGKPVMIQDAAVHFAWAPNQLKFAYFSGPNLIVQEVGGTTLPLQLGNTSQGLAGTALQWSPHGRLLAFSVKRSANFDIFTLSVSGPEPVIQTVVASPSDDIQPSWSPDGRHLAFYVRSSQYDTKLAVVPVDQSRAPFIIAHQVSISSPEGPQWTSSASLLYVGAAPASQSEDAVHTVDIVTGKHSSAPLSLVLEY